MLYICVCRLPRLDFHVDFRTSGFRIMFRHESASETVTMRYIFCYHHFILTFLFIRTCYLLHYISLSTTEIWLFCHVIYRPGLEKLRAESKKTIYGPITFNNLRIKDEKVKNSKRGSNSWHLHVSISNKTNWATGDFVKLKAGILVILYMAGSQCLSSLYPGPLLVIYHLILHIFRLFLNYFLPFCSFSSGSPIFFVVAIITKW